MKITPPLAANRVAVERSYRESGGGGRKHHASEQESPQQNEKFQQGVKALESAKVDTDVYIPGQGQSLAELTYDVVRLRAAVNNLADLLADDDDEPSDKKPSTT